MSEQQTKEALSTAAQWLGGTGALAAIGVFVRGLLNGSTGQEKELRNDLAARIEKLEAKVENLEKRLEQATRHRDAWRWACLTARLIAEELARRHGETLAPWEDPPKEES